MVVNHDVVDGADGINNWQAINDRSMQRKWIIQLNGFNGLLGMHK